MIVAIYARNQWKNLIFTTGSWEPVGLVLPDAGHSFLDFLRSPIDIHPQTIKIPEVINRFAST
jgi:hypothetical protein